MKRMIGPLGFVVVSVIASLEQPPVRHHGRILLANLWDRALAVGIARAGCENAPGRRR
jgi:hypothetical protein